MRTILICRLFPAYICIVIDYLKLSCRAVGSITWSCCNCNWDEENKAGTGLQKVLQSTWITLIGEMASILTDYLWDYCTEKAEFKRRKKNLRAYKEKENREIKNMENQIKTAFMKEVTKRQIKKEKEAQKNKGKKKDQNQDQNKTRSKHQQVFSVNCKNALSGMLRDPTNLARHLGIAKPDVEQLKKEDIVSDSSSDDEEADRIDNQCNVQNCPVSKKYNKNTVVQAPSKNRKQSVFQASIPNRSFNPTINQNIPSKPKQTIQVPIVQNTRNTQVSGYNNDRNVNFGTSKYTTVNKQQFLDQQSKNHRNVQFETSKYTKQLADDQSNIYRNNEGSRYQHPPNQGISKAQYMNTQSPSRAQNTIADQFNNTFVQYDQGMQMFQQSESESNESSMTPRQPTTKVPIKPSIKRPMKPIQENNGEPLADWGSAGRFENLGQIQSKMAERNTLSMTQKLKLDTNQIYNAYDILWAIKVDVFNAKYSLQEQVKKVDLLKYDIKNGRINEHNVKIRRMEEDKKDYFKDVNFYNGIIQQKHFINIDMVLKDIKANVLNEDMGIGWEYSNLFNEFCNAKDKKNFAENNKLSLPPYWNREMTAINIMKCDLKDVVTYVKQLKVLVTEVVENMDILEFKQQPQYIEDDVENEDL